MPKELENALKREAGKRGYGDKRSDAYVYGTMRKAGWKPSREKKKGKCAPCKPKNPMSDGTYDT